MRTVGWLKLALILAYYDTIILLYCLIPLLVGLALQAPVIASTASTVPVMKAGSGDGTPAGSPMPDSQRLQYPLIKEYASNHIKDPTII